MSQKHEVEIRKLKERVTRLEALLKTPSLPSQGNVMYRPVHKGWGKYDVVAVSGEAAKDLPKDEAHAKAAELNA